MRELLGKTIAVIIALIRFVGAMFALVFYLFAIMVVGFGAVIFMVCEGAVEDYNRRRKVV